MLVIGSPAKVKRPLTEEEIQSIYKNAADYNLTINTSYISLDQAADLIIEYIEKIQENNK